MFAKLVLQLLLVAACAALVKGAMKPVELRAPSLFAEKVRMR